MVTELARDTGFDGNPSALLVMEAGVQDANITELYPRIDPLNLTRMDWLHLPDGQKKAPLVDLGMQSYIPENGAKQAEIFPEGFMYPLSPIEERVFASASRVKNSVDGQVLNSDRAVLVEHLHLEGSSIDEAILVLQDFGRIQNEGGFWPTQHSVGGYELSRLTAYEIKEHVGILQKGEEIKLAHFEEMALNLKRAGIPMIEADEIELERLRAVVEARNLGKQALIDQARHEGYRHLRNLMTSQSTGQIIH